MNDFTTVFLFTNNTREIFDLALKDFGVTIISTILFIMLLVGIWTTPKKKKPLQLFSAITLSIILVTIGTFTFAISVKRNLESKSSNEQKYKELLNIYNSQQYEVTEGIVHVLNTEPFSSHAKGDVVSVGGIEFEISFFELTFGYNQTISHGGALTEGTYARIFYVEDSPSSLPKYLILRVDVKK